MADGCTLKTTVLPAASIPIALQMIVEVGLVTGVIAPMTPNGAGSMSESPWSPVTAWGWRSSSPGVFSLTRRFFTTLSSTRPRPVSSCAAFASAAACSIIVWRMDARIRARVVSGRRTNRGCALRAAATASSTVA